jgi:hypothetical protein
MQLQEIEQRNSKTILNNDSDPGIPASSANEEFLLAKYFKIVLSNIGPAITISVMTFPLALSFVLELNERNTGKGEINMNGGVFSCIFGFLSTF